MGAANPNTAPNPHLTCVWEQPRDWDSVDPGVDVPDTPGYYVFTDYSGPLLPTPPGKSVLYVGIATRSLRERITKYKRGDSTGLTDLHRGGLFLILSRAVAHAEPGRKPTRSVQTTPVEVLVKPTATKPGRTYTLDPKTIYLRWAEDNRAAIEALLVQQLLPRFNTMFK